LVCVAAGCKNNSDASAAAPDPAAVKAQQELVERRDKLLAARNQLQSDKDKLDAEIKQAQAAGKDTAELVKKRNDVDVQLDSQTADLIATMQSGFASLQATKDKSAQVAAREADVASRERAFTSREERLAGREAQLAAREAALAQREKDTCQGGGTMIIQAPKSGNYSRKD